jgi:hypothetical protein
MRKCLIDLLERAMAAGLLRTHAKLGVEPATNGLKVGVFNRK